MSNRAKHTEFSALLLLITIILQVEALEHPPRQAPPVQRKRLHPIQPPQLNLSPQQREDWPIFNTLPLTLMRIIEAYGPVCEFDIECYRSFGTHYPHPGRFVLTDDGSFVQRSQFMNVPRIMENRNAHSAWQNNNPVLVNAINHKRLVCPTLKTGEHLASWNHSGNICIIGTPHGLQWYRHFPNSAQAHLIHPASVTIPSDYFARHCLWCPQQERVPYPFQMKISNEPPGEVPIYQPSLHMSYHGRVVAALFLQRNNPEKHAVVIFKRIRRRWSSSVVTETNLGAAADSITDISAISQDGDYVVVKARTAKNCAREHQYTLWNTATNSRDVDPVIEEEKTTLKTFFQALPNQNPNLISIKDTSADYRTTRIVTRYNPASRTNQILYHGDMDSLPCNITDYSSSGCWLALNKKVLLYLPKGPLKLAQEFLECQPCPSQEWLLRLTLLNNERIAESMKFIHEDR